MNLSALFIKRPITTTLIMLGIIVFGVMAYQQLPVSDLPTVDFPTIQVNASLPGASPETLASAVALPLEKQFATIAGVTSINSTSSQGSTNITLQFDLGRDIDSATVDVQTAIAAVMPLLPAGMTSPPSFRKNNPADQPIMTVNLTSNTLPMSEIDDYAETLIAPRISMVNGVSQVQVQGASKYAVRVQLDPDKLHSQRIGLNEVDQALQNWNVNLPTGPPEAPWRARRASAPARDNRAWSRRGRSHRCGRPLPPPCCTGSSAPPSTTRRSWTRDTRSRAPPLPPLRPSQ